MKATVTAGHEAFREGTPVEVYRYAGPYDMNKLAVMPFEDEDREQFAQLKG